MTESTASDSKSPPQIPAEAAAEATLLPVNEAEVRFKPYTKAAGGFGALSATLRFLRSQPGLIRGTKALLRVNREEGFDCPGCAWPDPVDRGHLEFCENGAKAVAAETTKRRAGPEFFEQWTIPELLKQSDQWLEAQGRLTHPMVRRAGSDRYEPIAWEAAFALLEGHLNALSSPDKAIFYTSGRTSNEAAFLYQLFVRNFGTNNLPDCSNLCHESSGKGLGASIGIGKGTVSLEDFELAEAIFVIGQNPGTNHPRMLTTLQSAARRGCDIVSINPIVEPSLVRFKHPKEPWTLIGRGTVLSTLYLQVRINGDLALLKGIGKALLEMEQASPGVLDMTFIETHCADYDEYRAATAALSWDEICAKSGIERAQIRAAADVYAASKKTIICWAMGLTQHKNGVANVQEVANLLMLKGNLGRPGAGACPVRGHSNVQGDRTMGIWESPSAAFLDKLAEGVGFEPPRQHGLAAVDAVLAMHEGRASVFVSMGGNFLMASPDTLYTAVALTNCRLTAQISTKLNRSHLVTGEEALILPCLARTETDSQEAGLQFVSVENSMSIVHRSQGRFAPASESLKSEPAIVAGMAAATLGARSCVDWAQLVGDYDRIRDLIEASIAGFDDYNTRVREKGGFVLPNGVRERVFNTVSEKALFTVHELPQHELKPGQFLMTTIRSHDQYNTTIYSQRDRYRGVSGNRRVVLMSVADIDASGLESGTIVDLTSHFEGETRIAPRFVVLPFDLPKGSVATYFPEANVLIPIRSFADVSATPTSKSVVVSIERSDASEAGDPIKVA